MKMRAYNIWATALGILLGASCDETTSFQQKEDPALAGQSSADANVANGDRVTIGPNGERIITHADGSQTIIAPDGTITRIGPDGKILVNDASQPGGDSTAGDKRENDGSDQSNKAEGDSNSDDPAPENTLVREQSFPAAMIVDADARQDLTTGRLATTIAMQRVYTDKIITKRQIIRPSISDTFEQGHSGIKQSERFNQVANRLLDILIIVDNSHSMREEQANLANKLAPLLEYIQDADWRIGVVLTDPNVGCMRAVINKTDANVERAFANAISAGSNGDNNERGILTGVRAISGQCGYNSEWLRADSTLAVLVVTDEDNCSDGTGCPNKAYAKGSYLLDNLAKIREPGLNARIYGIFWHPSESERECRSGYNRAQIWSKLVEQTSGTWGSICDGDYTNTLRAVSRNLRTTLNTKFTLKTVPEAGSLQVYINGQEIRSGVSIQGKVVQLTPPPADGAVVTVNYVHGAQPILRSFPLKFKPLDGSVTVTVNGATLNNEAYSIDFAKPEIEFAAVPSESAKIAVNYTRDLPLPAQFLVGNDIHPGTLKVELDGVSTTEFILDETMGQVMFTVPPKDGTALQFAYTAVGDPVLRYALQARGRTPADISATDTQTNQALVVEYSNGEAVFKSIDFVEGREVTIVFDNPQTDRNIVRLAHRPIASTVSAEVDDMLCTGEPNLLVTDQEVDVGNCGFPQDFVELTVRYKFVAQSFREFVFELPELPAAGDWQEWKVYLDDQEASGWQRQGNVIVFSENLPADATVKVVLTQESR